MTARSTWSEVAQRVAGALDMPPGALVVLRDRCGRSEVLDAVVTAFEARGVSTVIDPASDAVLGAVLATTAPVLLSGWGRHRAAVLELADAVVSLGAFPPPVEAAPAAALAAFRAGRAEMEEVEARRRLPFLTVAVPTPRLAGALGRSLAELDDLTRAALDVDPAAVHAAAARVLADGGADPLVLTTPGCRLELRRGVRPWIVDDGRAGPGVTANLPTGSVYATVLEDSAEGTLRVPVLADVRDVVLTVRAGRVVSASDDRVTAWLDSFDAGARRISHLGVGLNPSCPPDTGWAVVDEHSAGAVFLALGENRYLGGTNASTLNHDIVLAGACLDSGEGCRMAP